MDKQEQAVIRAEQAAQLLANPLFVQAWDEARKAYLEAWASLPTSETEAAKDLHRSIKALDKVKKVIETHVANGKIAQKQIEAVAKPSVVRQIRDRYL